MTRIHFLAVFSTVTTTLSYCPRDTADIGRRSQIFRTAAPVLNARVERDLVTISLNVWCEKTRMMKA